MAGLALQDVEECEAKDRAKGKDQLEPRKRRLPRLLAARGGDWGWAVPWGRGPGRGRGGARVPACTLVGGLRPIGGAVGLPVLTPPAVKWDRACARGGGGRVCTARSPR